MVFTTEIFLEVAIESWPEWNLNSRPPDFVQTLLNATPISFSFSVRNEESECRNVMKNMVCSFYPVISAYIYYVTYIIYIMYI